MWVWDAGDAQHLSENAALQRQIDPHWTVPGRRSPSVKQN